MNDYVICTDSACDINPTMLEKWGIRYLSMSFIFQGSPTEYLKHDMEIGEFYQKMRDGGIAKTAAANPVAFTRLFEGVLKEGKDVLYLGLSGALSTTFNSAEIAASELREAYPNCKIITVDTLSASAGEGLLVYLATEQKKKGVTLEENAAYLEGIKLNVCHRFIVDDLVYLKGGGRVSAVAAVAGEILSIKPILYVNEEGKPLNIAKVRGKKAALNNLVDTYGSLAMHPETGPVFISHADCQDGVEFLSQALKNTYGVETDLVTDIGTVLGAHTGPGAVALFFIGKQR